MRAMRCALAALWACASIACAGSPVDESGASIIGGTDSSASDDAVVHVLWFMPGSDVPGLCSGTLLADNVVLTARHCVATTDEVAFCDSTGAPVAGGRVYTSAPTARLFVMVGSAPIGTSRHAFDRAVGVTRVLTPPTDDLCNSDLALLILAQRIGDARIASLRLGSPPRVGDTITAIGFGVTASETSPHRMRRAGIPILLVGPAVGPTTIGPSELLVGESVCSGDSGSPALDEDSHAIVGVASRGGNGLGSGDVSDCIDMPPDARARFVYTRVDAFADLIRSALVAADAEPWLEGEPRPTPHCSATFACATGLECSAARCVRPGTDAATVDAGAWIPRGGNVGCNATRARRSPGWWLWALVLAVLSFGSSRCLRSAAARASRAMRERRPGPTSRPRRRTAHR